MNSDRIFVKPAPGKVVRKPVGGHLPEAGDWVNPESYWLRRIADGDATDETKAQAKAEKAAK